MNLGHDLGLLVDQSCSQEEIEYTRALDDHDGRSFWRPSLLQFENITFYLQVEKLDMQWYFYVQMEGSAAECEKFETKVSVCKFPNSERHSICYNGKVCPIDIKGMDGSEKMRSRILLT